MNLKSQFILLALFLIITFLAFSNPSEDTYLSRVSDDYKKYHINAEIPVEVLQQIGYSNRSTFFLFSTFDYQFGGINVSYIGVANHIYYVGMKRAKAQKNPIKIV